MTLGTPVFTTFEGRLRAVDEALYARDAVRRLEDSGQIVVQKRRKGGHERVRRDPRGLVELLLSAHEQ